MGLVERGWNAHPEWETLSGAMEQQAFDRDLALFYEKISVKEMPCWSRMGINFRFLIPDSPFRMDFCTRILLSKEHRYAIRRMGLNRRLIRNYGRLL